MVLYYRYFKSILLVLFTMVSCSCFGQSVTISSELNIRSDYAYDLLGRINDAMVLYRDTGRKKFLNVYEQDLAYKYERQLRFEKDRVVVHGVIPYDTCFHIVYSYAEDSIYTVVRKYDDTATGLDTNVVFTTAKKDKLAKFEMVTNESKSHSLLYAYRKKEGLRLLIIDHDKQKVIYEKIVELVNVDFEDELLKIDFTNDLHIFLFIEKENRKRNAEKHHFILLNINPVADSYKEQKIYCRNQITIDVMTKYDPINKNYVIVGLYNEKESSHSKGIFYNYSDLRNFEPETQIELVPHTKEFLEEIYGRKKKKQDNLEYHMAKDILLTKDGGFVFFTEYEKVFSRRNPYQSYRYSSNYGGVRAWMDHHLEEVSISSFSREGELRWNKVLHKNQFSQDDGAAFSSFYLYVTPSILRVIFNEEIRNNNLVSDYIISPNGKTKRSSLLNTEYQDLKIRFQDAVQLSNKEFLVPSEKNGMLKLVKVSY